MFEKIKKCLHGDIVRPLLYMWFTRFLLTLCAALLMDFFWGKSVPYDMRAYAFVFLSVFFACLGWIAYLRLDGVTLPRILMKRVNIHKKPTRTYGDISDHLNDEIVSFDELEDKEKDVCCLLADAACCVIFAFLSFL